MYVDSTVLITAHFRQNCNLLACYIYKLRHKHIITNIRLLVVAHTPMLIDSFVNMGTWPFSYLVKELSALFTELLQAVSHHSEGLPDRGHLVREIKTATRRSICLPHLPLCLMSSEQVLC